MMSGRVTTRTLRLLIVCLPSPSTGLIDSYTILEANYGFSAHIANVNG
jgi:hypothetical protein